MSLLWPTAAHACIRGTSLGRFGRSRPDMPAAMAPDVTIRYSFFERSNWSTMPRSRWISICPPGAMRLVPTLMTTRILFLAAAGREISLAIRYHVAPTWRTQPPAGWDNTSIVPLEWLSWQGEKSCLGYYDASLERYQSLLRPRRKLRSLSPGISTPGP